MSCLLSSRVTVFPFCLGRERRKLAFVGRMLLLRVMPGVLIHCVGKNLRIKPPDPHSMEVETGPQRGPWRIKYFLEDYLGNLSKSEPVCWFPFIHLETKHQTNVVYLTDPGKKMQS